MRGNQSSALWGLLLIVAACGDDGPPYVPPVDGQSETCGVGSCSGCCSAGACLGGNDPNACGAAGFACVQCMTGEMCSAGMCVSNKQCNTTSCSGCCKGSTCFPGQTPTNCGSGAKPCVTCSEMEVCSNGKCVPFTNCTSSNCSGCCLNGTCQGGNSNTACGKGAAACVDCTKNGGTCSSGTCTNCTPKCGGKCAGASNECGGSCSTNQCTGCCKSFVCQGGTSNTACGTNGAACADCTTSGGTCTGGSCSTCTPKCSGKCAGASDECSSTCSTNLCTGCCQGTACQSGTTMQACGQGGGSCQACVSPDTCSGGSCQFDTSSSWSFVAYSAQIKSTTSFGLSWDVGIGASTNPDPFAKVTMGTYGGQTGPQTDTCFPTWNQTLFTAPASAYFGSSVKVELYDQDTSFHDHIGDCYLNVTQSDLKSGTKTAYNCDVSQLVQALTIKFNKQ